MSGLKAIRRRISSVKNTKQITRAMKLVSAAKLRRAQESAVGGRAFSKRLDDVLARVSRDLPENFSNPLLEPKEQVKVRRVVVVAGERGLCGAYNTNIVKAVAQEERAGDASLEFVAIGRRAVAAMRAFNGPVVEKLEGLAEDAGTWPLAEIGDRLMKDFLEGKCDEVVIYYTRFASAMTQVVTREVLLPFAAAAGQTASEADLRETEYDPAPADVLAQLIPLLVKTKLTQAALESKASEHAARMTAMDAATRNADELIDKLRLYYNRARQSAITRELIDIVGGAEAQK